MKLSALTNMWAIDAGAIRSLDSRASAMAELMASGMEPMSELTPDKRRIAYNGGNPLIPEIVGDTATLEVCGDIIARAPFFAKAFMDVVDPFDLADALDALAENESVKTIILEMDSCGGSASGTSEAYAAINRAQVAGKTVEVRAAGTLASAAYFIACAADRIIATPTTRVGSLGTLIVLCDETAANAMDGEKYEVISSSPAKGLGSDGAVTPALRTEAQRMVDALTAVFKDSVSAGRGFTDAQIAATFTGQVWLAAEALSLGLIDAVDSPADELETPDGAESPPEVIPAVTDGETESTPASAARAATEKKEPTMALDIKALAALAASHPHHQALILAEAAKDGATIDGINAAMATANAKAKDDEIAALKAKLSEIESAKAKAESEAQAKDDEIGKLKAHLPGYRDPGSDNGDGRGKTVTLAQYSAMKKEEREQFVKDNGRIDG